MEINKIRKLSNGRYRIVIQNEPLIFYEEVIIKYGLLYKKDIDISLISDIYSDNYFYTVYNSALKHIDKRARSKKEIYEYLINKYNDEDLINTIIEKLINNNLINDKLFCKNYIMDRIYLSKDGIEKIRKTLNDHNIDSKIIEESIKEVDISLLKDKLYKLIEKYIKINNRYSKNILKMKALNHFINLGYSKDDILGIYDSFNIKENSDILKKEYLKLYKKYSKKYDKYMLDNYIKSRLYQKGFETEEIDKVKLDIKN